MMWKLGFNVHNSMCGSTDARTIETRIYGSGGKALPVDTAD
jgi:hypothetical protein